MMYGQAISRLVNPIPGLRHLSTWFPGGDFKHFGNELKEQVLA